jgi:hypothetical protein
VLFKTHPYEKSSPGPSFIKILDFTEGLVAANIKKRTERKVEELGKRQQVDDIFNNHGVKN